MSGFDRSKFGTEVNELNQAAAEAKTNAKSMWFPDLNVEYELLLTKIQIFPPGTYNDGNPAPGQLQAVFEISNEVDDQNGNPLKGKRFCIKCPLTPQMAWKYTSLITGINGSEPTPDDILDALEGVEALVGKRMVIGHLVASKGAKQDGSPYDPNLQIKDTLTIG